jgi:hypothetical protein
MNDEKLTPEQIENWRRVLCGMIGPYALMMPAEQIQLYRDKLQGGLTQRAPDLGAGTALEDKNDVASSG